MLVTFCQKNINAMRYIETFIFTFLLISASLAGQAANPDRLQSDIRIYGNNSVSQVFIDSQNSKAIGARELSLYWRLSAGTDPKDVQGGIEARESSVYWQFSAGTLAGKKPNEEARGYQSFMFVSSYRLTPAVSSGIGIGLDLMDHIVVPLYADLKLLPPVERSYRPFLYIQAGKSFPVSKTSESQIETHLNRGGIFLGTGAGIFLPGREDFRWFVQVGFRYNELGIDVTNNWTDRQSKLIHQYHRLELRLGIFFS